MLKDIAVGLVSTVLVGAMVMLFALALLSKPKPATEAKKSDRLSVEELSR